MTQAAQRNTRSEPGAVATGSTRVGIHVFVGLAVFSGLESSRRDPVATAPGSELVDPRTRQDRATN